MGARQNKGKFEGWHGFLCFFNVRFFGMKKLIIVFLLLCSLQSFADPTERQKHRIERRIMRGTNPHARSNRKGLKIVMIAALVVIMKLRTQHD